MSTVEQQSIAVCLTLTDAISRTETVDEICDIALDAIEDGLGVARASVPPFDEDGVMRFMACRRSSASYRRAVEGHTPWQPTSPNPQPIVLVADIAMPEVDGYELIRLVRKLPEHVPAIAVSAHARPQDRAKALVSGFDGYCAKPIEADHFSRWCRRSSPIKSDWRIALDFTDEVPDHDWKKL